MSDMSIFTDKEIQPSDALLQQGLGSGFIYWKKVEELVMEKYPEGKGSWNFSGKKFGWSYQIKDKKRALIYLLPRRGYFKVALVFGEKAFQEILNSTVSQQIKAELSTAPKYAEGRGIRIDVRDEQLLGDIGQLIPIKIAH